MKMQSWGMALLVSVALACSPGCHAEGADSVATNAANGTVSPIQPIDWVLRLPAVGNVSFRGVADFNHAGVKQSAMLYPAPNLIGMLAAVATHAALVKSSRNSEKEKIQAQADKVLEPYKGILAAFSYDDLRQRLPAFVENDGDKPPLQDDALQKGAWLVVSTPVFSMTQDRSAIVLDNTVAMFAPGQLERPAYTNVVRVVSDPRAHAGSPDAWAADGNALKDESARLFADSFDVVFRDAQINSAEAPYKTVRYTEGDAERMERGQLLAQVCGRAVLKTLRGTLMSVPVRAGEASSSDNQCGRGTAGGTSGEPQQTLAR